MPEPTSEANTGSTSLNEIRGVSILRDIFPYWAADKDAVTVSARREEIRSLIQSRIDKLMRIAGHDPKFTPIVTITEDAGS